MKQEEVQLLLPEKKYLPLRKQSDTANLLVVCGGQCRYEQEEEFNELFNELRSSLGGIVLGLTNIECHWTQLSLTDFMSLVKQLKEMATNMGNLMNSHLPGLDGQDFWSPEELDVTKVVEKVVKRYAVRASTKNITLTFHPLLSTVILGEWVVIRQIVENLISNALKFSPPDSSVNVFVAVSSFSAMPSSILEQWEVPHEENDSIRFVRLEVHDSGPGVTLEDKRRLFERHARLSAQPTGGEISTGMGLYVVKKLTDAAGGRVWCESSPEQGLRGSKFIVEFPLLNEI